MTPREGINDFVVRFANVNGTGSASANNLFAKAVFRMGIPISPKNIFPSNIQGLPTWYEVRVSEEGYLGRREGVDVMVCVNPQSLPRDLASVKSGGTFIYDSTKPLGNQLVRDDITYVGIPMTEMANRAFTNPRIRQLLKNIIYVGGLAVLIGLDIYEVERLLTEQFGKKPHLLENNLKALQLGMNYVREHVTASLPVRLERRDLLGDSIMVDGNLGCGLGAVFGGATVVAWYPITPSTSVAEAFEQYAKIYRVDSETGERRYAIVQAEDELAAMGMVLGATWAGARAFTATSGPGLSLMNEFLGFAYFAELPAVLIDVQRTGPSTGMPTRTQQSDLLLAAYASHGDTKHVLLFPSDPTECFELTATSFDLAERFQTPIMVMTDLDLGMNDYVCKPFTWDDTRKYDRGKQLSADELEGLVSYGRYLDVDGDGITYRNNPGSHPQLGAYTTRGTSRDEYARYTEDSSAYKRNMDRLALKWETIKSLVPKAQIYDPINESDLGMLFFGTSTQAAEEARDQLAKEGTKLDAIRILAFPFGEEVVDFIAAHRRIFVVEQNRDAQMRSLLLMELGIKPSKLVPVLHYDGMPITADTILRQVTDYLNSKKEDTHELSKTSI